MNNITVIYYTANRIDNNIANNIRQHLLSILPTDTPIISVSHKPIDFGYNICVSGFVFSIYNVYKQILIGAREAKTRYVLCAEDDSLYTKEHIAFRPKDNVFAYNINRWHIYNDVYFYRPRPGMHTCIANRELMIRTLEQRYAKFSNFLYEEKGELIGFGEPGRSEIKLGLPYVPLQVFRTTIPVLVFDHRGSLGGIRKICRKDRISRKLPFWGNANDLWVRMGWQQQKV